MLPRTNYISHRYCTIDPTKFRIGDIVEAQVSFTSVPLKEKKYKMIIVLRALTILDSTVVKVSVYEQMN